MKNEQVNNVNSGLEEMLVRTGLFINTTRSELLNIAENQVKIFKDDLAHAQDERIMDSRIALNDHQRMLEGRIKTALRKLRLGTYGTCDRCEEAVGTGRLTVQAFANYCVRCQSLAENLGEFRMFTRSAQMAF